MTSPAVTTESQDTTTSSDRGGESLRASVNVSEHVESVRRAIERLETNAEFWGDRHTTGLLLIQAYTIVASLIMGFNLALKENIQNVGGWIPFCLAAAALTTIVTFLANNQYSEDPVLS